MENFTEQEAKEIGAPIELLNKWQEVMNVMWGFLTAYASAEKKVKLINKENKIWFRLGQGKQFVISVNMYNKSYLSLNISIHDVTDFEATVNMIDQFGEKGIVRIVSEILTSGENIH